MEMLQANAYYTFSHRRFSFPAAFTQSQVQLRSKGSWLLGLSAFAGRIDTGSDVVPGASKSRLLAINVAVGGGYAYNLVLKRKWLIHLSAMPHIVVYSRNKLTVGDVRQRSPFRFPSLINIGRFAAVRNFKNSFIGMSAVVNLWHQGDSGEMMIESVKWARPPVLWRKVLRARNKNATAVAVASLTLWKDYLYDFLRISTQPSWSSSHGLPRNRPPMVSRAFLANVSNSSGFMP